MTDRVSDDQLIYVCSGRYCHDILGIPGVIMDDGELRLFVDGLQQMLVMPAPAASILEDIYARQAARDQMTVAPIGIWQVRR